MNDAHVGIGRVGAARMGSIHARLVRASVPQAKLVGIAGGRRTASQPELRRRPRERVSGHGDGPVLEFQTLGGCLCLRLD